MTEFNGKVHIKDSAGEYTTVALDGDKGWINLYDSTGPGAVISIDSSLGKITFSDSEGGEAMSLGTGDPAIAVKSRNEDRIILGLGGEDHPVIVVKDHFGHDRITIDGNEGTLWLRDSVGRNSITVDGSTGDVMLYDQDGHHSFSLHGKVGSPGYSGLWLGANATEGPKPGIIFVRDSKGSDSIILDGAGKYITIGKSNVGNQPLVTLETKTDGFDGGRIVVKAPLGGQSLTFDSRVFIEDGARRVAELSLGSNKGDNQGYMRLRNNAGSDSIILDGGMGDISLTNSDCAEEFEISGSTKVEPGTVMVINNQGKLQGSEKEYDNKVAGVISGAGDYKPGIILGKNTSRIARAPVALVGRVFCKVDAQYSPIDIGDMLTTSPTPGHAMKADDPFKAFGAVIGKALNPLKTGKGLIPILIALQ